MNIVVIGAGNVANHYAKALYSLGHTISQIYNRTTANAIALADAVYAQSIDNLDELDLHADLYLIAISDNFISNIVEQLSSKIQGIVIHTSGATDIQILNKFKKFAVIYPPQSLNKQIHIDLSQIPFAIEGSDKHVEESVLSLALTISAKSFLCNSRQRLALHVSSVFANNFTNVLFGIANSILDREKLDFDLIKPIILETAKKVQNHSPKSVQTGPAIRNDFKTINSHLQFLSYSDELNKIYQVLSDFIIKSRLN